MDFHRRLSKCKESSQTLAPSGSGWRQATYQRSDTVFDSSNLRPTPFQSIECTPNTLSRITNQTYRHFLISFGPWRFVLTNPERATLNFSFCQTLRFGTE